MELFTHKNCLYNRVENYDRIPPKLRLSRASSEYPTDVLAKL